MKKFSIISIIYVLLMLLTIFSCSNESAPEPVEMSQEAAETLVNALNDVMLYADGKGSDLASEFLSYIATRSSKVNMGITPISGGGYSLKIETVTGSFSDFEFSNESKFAGDSITEPSVASTTICTFNGKKYKEVHESNSSYDYYINDAKLAPPTENQMQEISEAFSYASMKIAEELIKANQNIDFTSSDRAISLKGSVAINGFDENIGPLMNVDLKATAKLTNGAYNLSLNLKTTKTSVNQLFVLTTSGSVGNHSYKISANMSGSSQSIEFYVDGVLTILPSSGEEYIAPLVRL